MSGLLALQVALPVVPRIECGMSQCTQSCMSSPVSAADCLAPSKACQWCLATGQLPWKLFMVCRLEAIELLQSRASMQDTWRRVAKVTEVLCCRMSSGHNPCRNVL